MRCFKGLAFAIAFLAVAAIGDSGEFGVKEAGKGLAGSATSLDATSIYTNPASAGLIRSSCFSAGYSRLAWGIGGAAIERGIGSYVYRRPEIGGAALSFSILNQDVSYYSRLGLTIAPEFELFRRRFAVGLTGTWYQTGYRPSRFTGHDDGPDPLFADATQKNAFGLSAGAIANVYRALWFGASARDINEPNLAFQDTVAYGKRPIELQAGFYYPFRSYFKPSLDLLWRNETINGDAFTRVRFGAEASLPKGFRVRAGYDGTGIDAGLTLHSSSLFGGLDLDYAFVYPLESGLAEVGAVSHHFGLSIWAAERKPMRLDLVADGVEAIDRPVPNIPNRVEGRLQNIGHERTGGFSVTLASLDSVGKWRMIYPVKYLDGLPPDSAVTLSWNWKPKAAGEYTLRMTVDDDGSELPFINGRIEERKEDNNIAETKATVGSAGGFDFSIETRKAYVTRLEYVVEEKPLLPIIFFEPGEADIDSEDVALMGIYARRLRANPDAQLVVEGFFDPSDAVACTAAARLELRRAEALKSAIISFDDRLEDRIRIANSIDCAEPVYRIDPAKAIRDASAIAAENRRAELHIEFPAIDSAFAKYSLSEGEVDVPASFRFDDAVIELLKRNQDALLIVEGGFDADEDSTVGLARAEALRQAIYKHDRTLLPGKVRIFPGWNGAKVRATLNGEGILWAPMTSEPSVVGFENLEPETTTLHITPINFERIKIDSSRVEIITPDGQLVRRISDKPGMPPRSVDWDWHDEGGHLIKPDSWVRVRVTTFLAGRKNEFVSQGKEGRMQVRVKDIQRSIHRLLVVQFVFDETAPMSHFLESRLDALAHGIASEAKAKLSPSIQLAGHTDAIGSEKHNLALSTARASRELAVLRLYLAHYLGLSKPSDVDAWLASHDAVIDAKGYGASRPYTLSAIGPDGVAQLLGDNSTPKGRNINRRVTVEHGVDEKK